MASAGDHGSTKHVPAFFPPFLALAAKSLALATGIGRDPRIRASPRYCRRERKVGAVGNDFLIGGFAKFFPKFSSGSFFGAIVK